MRKSALFAFALVVAALVALGLIVLSSASEANGIRLHKDAYFFITKDSYVVNDAAIDLMTPAYAVEYFDYLKTGLSLSDNFYDKYDSLIIRRRIMMAFFAILAGLSLAAAAVPLFLSKEQKTVGAARGSDWKS